MSALAIVSVVVSVGCVAASIRRLIYAMAPTALDPAVLLDALRGDKGHVRYRALATALEAVPEAMGGSPQRARISALDGCSWLLSFFSAHGQDQKLLTVPWLGPVQGSPGQKGVPLQRWSSSQEPATTVEEVVRCALFWK